jgi:UDP-N-acetylmuramoyl-L-alanyl-D-glutamate--2,6-diaminopimelate ligase
MIAGFAGQGADVLIMEVSSHALEQSRVAGINFEVGVFTNLTPEHLDYHENMASYFASKKRLFDEYIVPSGAKAVVNIDDPYGRKLAENVPGCLTCGLAAEAVVRAENVTLTRDGITADIVAPQGSFRLQSELLGGFNVSNLLSAIATAIALEIPSAAILEGIAQVPVVPGRIEKIDNDRGALILVDYAHTGDALENVLKAVAELDASRVVTVFGCGGDRDRNKRPVMGEVAGRYSDLVIVTSDNPRTEDPETIIEEILPGVMQHFDRQLSQQELLTPAASGVYVTPDRLAALQLAVTALQPGDILLVAGKGHEDYQILGKEKIHFDDREEIRRALQAPGRH